MAAPLTICTKQERRRVKSFLYVGGVKPAEIICYIKAQYDDSYLLQQDLRMDRELQTGKELDYATTKD
ncbi:hypothetical protein TNCV_298031 [Trichonephila clavipes]|nr:hypothetical protein TNCV_298031 [Trichonephila clavipes]